MSANLDLPDVSDLAIQKPSAGKYNSLIEKHAADNGIDPDLIRHVMGAESSGKPNAVSEKGAQGLMQLMPPTAARFGVTNIKDPDQNIGGGARYLKWLLDRYNGDTTKALAGYNAGEGAVDKYHGVPPYKQTQEYVPKVLKGYTGNGYRSLPDVGDLAIKPSRTMQPTMPGVADSPLPDVSDLLDGHISPVSVPAAQLQTGVASGTVSSLPSPNRIPSLITDPAPPANAFSQNPVDTTQHELGNIVAPPVQTPYASRLSGQNTTPMAGDAPPQPGVPEVAPNQPTPFVESDFRSFLKRNGVPYTPAQGKQLRQTYQAIQDGNNDATDAFYKYADQVKTYQAQIAHRNQQIAAQKAKMKAIADRVDKIAGGLPTNRTRISSDSGMERTQQRALEYAQTQAELNKEKGVLAQLEGAAGGIPNPSLSLPGGVVPGTAANRRVSPFPIQPAFQPVGDQPFSLPQPGQRGTAESQIRPDQYPGQPNAPKPVIPSTLEMSTKHTARPTSVMEAEAQAKADKARADASNTLVDEHPVLGKIYQVGLGEGGKLANAAANVLHFVSPSPGVGSGEAEGIKAVADFLKGQAGELSKSSQYESKNENFLSTLTSVGANAGMGLADLMTVQKLTGASMATIMGSEAAVQNLDQPAATLAKETVKGYAFGKFFDLLNSQAFTALGKAAKPTKIAIQGGFGYTTARVAGEKQDRALVNALVFAGLETLSKAPTEGETQEARTNLGIKAVTETPETMGLRDKIASKFGYANRIIFTDDGRYAQGYYNPKRTSFFGKPLDADTVQQYIAQEDAQNAPSGELGLEKKGAGTGSKFVRVDSDTFDKLFPFNKVKPEPAAAKPETPKGPPAQLGTEPPSTVVENQATAPQPPVKPEVKPDNQGLSTETPANGVEPKETALNVSRETPEVADRRKTEGLPPIGMQERRDRLAGRIKDLRLGRRSAERAAETDSLTGLANQASWLKAKPAAEADPNVRILSIDLNNFKSVNDTEGHDAGNEILIKSADIARDAAAEFGENRVFRSGGDEFALAVPPDKADDIANRIEELGAKLHTVDSSQGKINVSLSVGRGNTLKEADQDLEPRKKARKGGNVYVREGATNAVSQIGKPEGSGGELPRTEAGADVHAHTGEGGNGEGTEANASDSIVNAGPGEEAGQVKQPWEMTRGQAVLKTAQEAFPIEGKVEIVNEKPVYSYSSHGITITNRGPLNGTQSAERLHRKIVEKALSEGKPVPSEVLADYPDLAKDQGPGTKHPETGRKFSSTQTPLRADVVSKVKSLSQSIPDSELAADGRETDPHITLKYGLHTEDPQDVEKILSGEGPIKAKIGKVSIFPAKEGTDYDVVKMDIESPDLHRLNKKVAEGTKVTDTHPEYKPHITLAYVKPGEGAKYVGMKNDLTGREIELNKVEFSGRGGQEKTIPLIEAGKPGGAIVEPEWWKELTQVGKDEARKAVNIRPKDRRSWNYLSKQERDSLEDWNKRQQSASAMPEFKKWFAGSKVTDDQGQPLIVYHGSPNGVFDKFDTARFTESSGTAWHGEGFYFAPKFSEAKGYAFGPKAVVHEAYLNIKNPAISVSSTLFNVLESNQADVPDADGAFGYELDSEKDVPQDVIDKINSGHFTFEDISPWIYTQTPEEYVVKSPDQIKIVGQRDTKGNPISVKEPKSEKAKPTETAAPDYASILEEAMSKIDEEEAPEEKPKGLISRATEFLIAKGIPAPAAEKSAKALAVAMQEKTLNGLMNVLDPNNDRLRAFFEKETGEQLGRTIKSTREVLTSWIKEVARPVAPKAVTPKQKREAKSKPKPVVVTPVAQSAKTLPSDIADGLAALFPKGGIFGDAAQVAKVQVDQKVYGQIQPLFEKAISHFDSLTPENAFRAMVRSLVKDHGFTTDQIRAMSPYITRFMQDRSVDTVEKQAENKPEVQNADTIDTSRNGPEGDAGTSTADVPGTTEGGKIGKGGEGESDLGDGNPRPDEGRGEGQTGDVEKVTAGENTATDEPQPIRGGNRDSAGDRVPERRGNDYIAPVGSLAREGSWKDAAKRNLDAIELVKQLEAENRLATPEEQAQLAKYTGWGASELANNMFPGYREEIDPYYAKAGWEDLVKRAVSLFNPEELKTAKKSTQYAHYTSEKVIRGIWTAFVRMGFVQGKILEPGMGVGLFPVAAPADVITKSSYTGIEMDSFTARIAKQILQNQAVLEADFVKQKLPNNFFDIAIGNPPFSSTPILEDRAYKKYRFMLHDFFFAKTIDKVRPGGLLAFVTSKGTMDKLDAKARQYIADRADLLGAIRLPQTAFKQNAGTEVVTDVLFFRKRLPDEAPSGEAWLSHKEVTAKNSDKEDQTGQINEYFVNHPEMVLGEHSFTGKMRQRNMYNVLPREGDIEQHFLEAIENLPNGIFAEQAKVNSDKIAEIRERDWNPTTKKEGSLYIHADGTLMRVEHGSGVQLSSVEKLNAPQEAWLKSYIGVRTALKQAQLDQLKEGDWEKSLRALNKAYDSFVKKHGYVLDFTLYDKVTEDEDGNKIVEERRRYKNSKALNMDIESPLVEALEQITEDNKIIKGPMLLRRTIKRPEPPQINTLSDALAVSLDQLGTLNLDHVQKLITDSGTPMNREDVIKDLGEVIFEVPGGTWQMRDEYLSGYVIQKLEEAEAAARMDTKYSRNVKALLAVQPKPLLPAQITVGLGSAWIPTDYITQFAQDHLGIRGETVSFNPIVNHWAVTGASGPGSQSYRIGTAEWGTSRRSPSEILEAALSGNAIKIYDTIDKKQVLNESETAAANDKIKKMKQEFKSWVWTDTQRAQDLTAKYNRQFNNIVPRTFDGSHLTLPGLSAIYKLHPHQLRAVWRVLQSGNTYLAHAVGAGKTLEMIVSAMEQKRLGLISKPMFIVPGHMLKQFSSEFLDAYPMGNILVADEESFKKENRRKFVAKAALNDLDAVIMTHTSFGKISVKPESSQPIVDALIDQLRQSIDELEAGGNSQTSKRLIKRIEKRIEDIERRFASRTLGEGKDDVINFEDMGVDFLYVDEAHMFRKLDFVTNHSQIKGINAEGSQRALDLHIKLSWLNHQRPGRSTVLASGTPITNTLGELYTVQRFMDPQELEDSGTDHFDAWAAMFGQIVPGYEMNAAGKYELVERFAEFINVPELMKRVRQFMDVLTLSQLGDLIKLPLIEGGQPNIIVTKPTPKQLDHLKVLEARIEVSRKWKPSKDQPNNPDPLIAIIADARLGAIDMRYIEGERGENDPNSKLNTLIAEIIKSHNDFKDIEYTDKLTEKPDPIKGAAQIVFAVQGFGEAVIANRGFDAKKYLVRKLGEGGIPARQIAFISDYKTADAKEALFKEMRNGSKKVLIGSPGNMGTGVNVQKRLKREHFLSPPWFPADVEQPDGRIIRQGNQNEQVMITRYATKGTYDSTGWAMNARKARSIEQAMTGDDSQRTISDISESSLYEQASAMAAGDERAVKLASLRRDIEVLERLQTAHRNQQHDLRWNKGVTENSIKSTTRSVASYQAAIDAVGSEYIRSENFRITANGGTFEKRQEQGEALLTALKAAVGKHAEYAVKTGQNLQIEIGKAMDQFPITLVIGRVTEKWPEGKAQEKEREEHPEKYYVADFKPRLDVASEQDYLYDGFIMEKNLGDLDAQGLATRVYNKINSYSKSKSDSERTLKQQELQLRQIEAKLGTPFESEQELYEKIADFEQLQTEMAAGGGNTDAAMALADGWDMESHITGMDSPSQLTMGPDDATIAKELKGQQQAEEHLVDNLGLGGTEGQTMIYSDPDTGKPVSHGDRGRPTPAARASIGEINNPHADLEDIQAIHDMALVNARFPLHPQPLPGYEDAKIKASDVIRQLEGVLKALDRPTPIRVGVPKQMKARGFYNSWTEVIRLRTANNIPTASHEVGHALHKVVFGEISARTLKPIGRRGLKELVVLGKILYGSRKPPGGYRTEGFAEFLRHYLTLDDAQKVAPFMHDYFTKTFLPSNPIVAKELGKSKDIIDTYKNQGALNRASANMVKYSARQKLDEVLAKVKEIPTYLVDEFTPYIKLANDANKMLPTPLRPSEDPWQVASFQRGRAYAVVRHMVEDGMIDLNSNPVGPSLRDALALIKPREAERFQQYVWAAHALDVIGEGKNPGLSAEDARFIVKELGSARFQVAAQSFYDFKAGVLEYMRQAAPELTDAINAMGKKWIRHVPLKRWFDPGLVKVPGGGGTANPLPRLKGSGREIKEIFPQIIADMTKMVTFAHKQMVLRTLVNISKLEGMGHLIEEVPIDKVPERQAVRQIEKQLIALGADLSGVNLDEMLTFFVPAQSPKGQDPIVPIMVNGQMKWYQVPRELYAGLEGLDSVKPMSLAAEIIFGMPARAFRLGTTGVRASFSLVTNPIRDIPTFYFQTKSNAWLPRLMYGWAKAMAGEFDPRRLAGHKSEGADMFSRLGLEMSQPLGVDRASTRRLAKEVLHGTTFNTVTHPIEAMRAIFSLPEAGPRVAEVMQVLADRGWKPGQLLTMDDAIAAGNAGKQVTVDFGAAGKWGKQFNRITSFFNANIQGNRQFVRRAAGREGKRAQYRSFLRGLWMVGATLGLWYMHKDKKWYANLDARERARFWFFEVPGTDQVIRLPRSQEWSLMFASIPEAIVDAWYRKDPEEFKDSMGYAFDSAMPPVIPTSANAVWEQLENHLSYFDKPIVPRRQEDLAPNEQYGPYTSPTARMVGNAVTKIFGPTSNTAKYFGSPERIDQMLTSTTGGVGRDLADFPGTVKRATGHGDRAYEASDLPVVGRLFERGGKDAVSERTLNKFYDALQLATQRSLSKDNPETEQERIYRLQLEDASKAIKTLGDSKKTFSPKERREAQDELISIATKALEHKSTYAPRPIPPGKKEIMGARKTIRDQRRVESYK